MSQPVAQNSMNNSARRFAAAIWLALTVQAPPAIGQDPWQSHTTAAKQALERKDYGQAEGQFSDAFKLAASFPLEDGRLPDSIMNLGEVYRAQKQWGKAERLYLDWLPRLDGPYKDKPVLAAMRLAAAQVSEDQGKFDQAAAHYDRYLKVQRLVFLPFDLQLARAIKPVAEFHRRQKNLTRAEELYQQMADICRKTPLTKEFATAIGNLAAIHLAQQRFDLAAADYSRFQEVKDAIPQNDDDYETVIKSFETLREFCSQRPPHPEAVALYKLWREIALKQPQPDIRDLLPVNFNLAEIYRGQEKLKQAEPLYRECLATIRKGPREDDGVYLATFDLLAKASRGRKEYDAAERYYRDVLDIREIVLQRDDPEIAASLRRLADICRIEGRYKEATPMAERAVNICKARHPIHPDTAASLGSLAKIYAAQGDYIKAEDNYREALGVWAVTKTDNLESAAAAGELAELILAQGKAGEAEKLYRQALDTRSKAEGQPELAETLYSLAQVNVLNGKLDEAKQNYRRLMAILEKKKDQPALAWIKSQLARIEARPR